MKSNIKLLIMFSMSFLLISASPKKSKSVKSETKKADTTVVSVSSTTTNSANTSDTSSGSSSDDLSGVMVDNLSDEDVYDTTSDKQYEAENTEGIPYSYGVIKGTINVDGKSVVVMEQEDGGINLIQIYIDKASVKWKLIGQIKRS